MLAAIHLNIGRPFYKSVGDDQRHASKNESDAYPARAAQIFPQEPLRKKRDGDQVQAEDSEGGANIEEFKRLRIDESFERQNQDAWRNPEKPIYLRDRRFFQKDLSESLEDSTE